LPRKRGGETASVSRGDEASGGFLVGRLLDAFDKEFDKEMGGCQIPVGSGLTSRCKKAHVRIMSANPMPDDAMVGSRKGGGNMGALIDKIAASGNLSSYTRPAHDDESTEALRAAHTIALDLAEDLRDLGLDISVAWEIDWVMLSWPGGSDCSFIAKSRDTFQLGDNRKRAVSRDELLSEIVKWIETVQTEGRRYNNAQKGRR